ncbi:hypothetical protein [Pseudomonas sp.]|uniref:hypothetical protein n=1 Tax=Pseudomonas sp. TaxID=306 RepID=UPI0025892406|nr:hypothetical protein [Pseudomonas sp.]
MQTRQKLTKRNERLSKTKQGQALLELIRQHGTSGLAAILGADSSAIGLWVYRGQVSRRGAELIEEKLGISKAKMRPDLKADDWECPGPGPQIGQRTKHDGADQILLIDLAAHFGSVALLCEKLGVSVGTYHNWKSRNRIATKAVNAMLRFRLPADLRARLEAIPR